MQHTVEECLDLLTDRFNSERSNFWENRRWGQYVTQTYDTFEEAKERAVELTKKLHDVFKADVTLKNSAEINETKNAPPRGHITTLKDEHFTIERSDTPVTLLESTSYPGTFRVIFELISLFIAPPFNKGESPEELDRLAKRYGQEFISRVTADIEFKKTFSSILPRESKQVSDNSASVQALVQRGLSGIAKGAAPVKNPVQDLIPNEVLQKMEWKPCKP